jgi:hypothetical protein
VDEGRLHETVPFDRVVIEKTVLPVHVGLETLAPLADEPDAAAEHVQARVAVKP